MPLHREWVSSSLPPDRPSLPRHRLLHFRYLLLRLIRACWDPASPSTGRRPLRQSCCCLRQCLRASPGEGVHSLKLTGRSLRPRWSTAVVAGRAAAAAVVDPTAEQERPSTWAGRTTAAGDGVPSCLYTCTVTSESKGLGQSAVRSESSRVDVGAVTIRGPAQPSPAHLASERERERERRV